MASLFDTRRYLTDFDSTRTGNLFTDVLIIGSGLAGSRAAIEAARHASVTLITKDRFDRSASFYAQGGIAAAIGPKDSPTKHFDDTLRVGANLNRKDAIHLLVDNGPARIEELIEWNTELDRNDHNDLALTREGGHSVHRVIHARGDRTGQELVAKLESRVRATENIRVFENCFLIDFITVDGVCMGAVTYNQKHGHQLIWARQTILCSGGCGQVWRETTNPPVATGDGIAAAFRAGAKICNVELMQFHPTTLYIAGAGRSLISEAVRGEGAYLVDKSGYRFMQEYHKDGELAPRDIVSRAIRNHIHKTQANCMYLDVRHLDHFNERFPQITQLCADFEINVKTELIPVRPSAHYMIGGVDVDLQGQSSVQGLLCCGEAACTGVHGANRLASNSLLEGLVFGKIAGEKAGQVIDEANGGIPLKKVSNQAKPSSRTELNLSDIRNSLQSLMWHNVGIERTGERLIETCEIVDFWGHYTLDKVFDEPFGWEIQNQLTLARLIATGARERAESIGVHFRLDATSGANEADYEVVVARNEEGTRHERRNLPGKANRPNT